MPCRQSAQVDRLFGPRVNRLHRFAPVSFQSAVCGRPVAGAGCRQVLHHRPEPGDRGPNTEALRLPQANAMLPRQPAPCCRASQRHVNCQPTPDTLLSSHGSHSSLFQHVAPSGRCTRLPGSVPTQRDVLLQVLGAGRALVLHDRPQEPIHVVLLRACRCARALLSLPFAVFPRSLLFAAFPRSSCVCGSVSLALFLWRCLSPRFWVCLSLPFAVFPRC